MPPFYHFYNQSLAVSIHVRRENSAEKDQKIGIELVDQGVQSQTVELRERLQKSIGRSLKIFTVQLTIEEGAVSHVELLVYSTVDDYERTLSQVVFAGVPAEHDVLYSIQRRSDNFVAEEDERIVTEAVSMAYT